MESMETDFLMCYLNNTATLTHIPEEKFEPSGEIDAILIVEMKCSERYANLNVKWH